MRKLTAAQRPYLALLCMCCLLVLVLVPLVVQAAPLFQDDFEDGQADGWSTTGGSWAVVADGSQVYRQAGSSADARALAGNPAWADQVVATRVKPLAFNGADRFVALVARAQSSTSYYYLALRSSGRLELKRLVAGSATTLATATVTVSTSQWYTLRLSVQGSSLSGSLNGQVLVSASDTRFASGRIGLATFYASAAFDDVLVEGTTTTPSPTAVTPTSSPTAVTPTPVTPTAVTRTPTPVTPTPVTPTVVVPTPVPGDGPIGFASVNALGQNGTTGGAGGPVVTVSSTEQLLSAINTTGPLIIRVQGTINITSKQGVRPNKTIVGVGTTAVINGGGLDFYRSYNVIIRNIRFTNAEDDAINVGQNSHHIWIDHNEFVSPVDGSIDIVRGAEYVTVSWNWFRGTDKSMLIGHSDGAASEDIGHLKVTIHHNFFDGSRQRHPRVRFGEPVHVFNNYFRSNELYGVASTMNAGVLVEGNYFENVPFPIYGRSGYADSDPGRVVERNNIYVNSGNPSSEVNGTVVEPSTYYSYRLDSPSSIPSIIPSGVGVGKIN